MPFCNNCNYGFRNKKITDWIKGSYCHSCKKKDEVISKHYPLCKECEPFDRYKNSIDDNYLEELNEYRQMSLTELQKIKPLWCCDKNKPALKELRMCDILDVIHSTEKLNTIDVFNNQPRDNRRTMNTLSMWKRGILIEPSSILHENLIRISNGRHRILAAHFLGAETIPVYWTNKN